MKALSIIEDHIENLSRVVDYIEQHIDDKVKMEVPTLAKQARMSLWHFQKVFHALVGEPVKSYVRRRCLTYASRLLLESKASLSGIAGVAGFGSQEAFSRAFQRQFGVTPGMFRTAGLPAEVPSARARIDKDYIIAMFEQRDPPEISVVTLESRQLLGIRKRIVPFFSEGANGPQVALALWETLKQLITQYQIPEVVNLWAVLNPLENTEDLEYCASFESSRPISEILQSLPKSHRPVLSPTVLPKGTYAVFSQKNPATEILYNLNYLFCVWLMKSEYELAGFPEFELYAPAYCSSDPNCCFTYGIPVRRTT